MKAPTTRIIVQALAGFLLTMLGVGLNLLVCWLVWSPGPGWLGAEPIAMTALIAIEARIANKVVRETWGK